MVNINDYVEMKTIGTGLYTMYGNKPLINELLPSDMIESLVTKSYNTDLMDWYKVTPEAITFVQSITTDVMSDGYYFEGATANKKKAQDFADENYFDSVMEAFLNDMFVEGNGFMWKKRVTNDQIKEFCDSFAKRHGMGDVAAKIFGYKAVIDEEATRIREIAHIPASTLQIVPKDRFGSELSYIQTVGTYKSKFSQDEVIHIRDINLNGELWGYSRMKAILNEVQMLALNKDYQGAFFNNHGLPAGVLNLPRDPPNSPNYKLVKSQIEELKKAKERHRILLFTGEISWTMFERMKDMEFKNLADYLTKVIAMIYQVPPSRYGGSGQTGEETNLSNQGYYRNVSHLQTKVETIMNNQLWMPEFKVKMKYNRSYKEDEVREVQIDKIKTDIIQQRLLLGLVSTKAAADYLRIPEDQRPSVLGTPQVDPSIIGKKFNQFNEGQSNDQLVKDEPKSSKDRSKTPKNRSAASDIR